MLLQNRKKSGTWAALSTKEWGTQRPDSNPPCTFPFQKAGGQSATLSASVSLYVNGSCWDPKLSQRQAFLQ